MQKYIGTSGWVYPHWHQSVYPKALPEADWLQFYAKRFNSVEINHSFYRLPTAENIDTWYGSTPEGFLFSVKASRYITHMKKLTESEQTLKPFLQCVEGLGNKLGPVLFQLPPKWRCNPARLNDFLKGLPVGIKAAFEFRDRSWHNDEVRSILARHNAAFCIFDIGGFTSPKLVTADFIYLRLHGPDQAYRGSYSKTQLGSWAEWLEGQDSETAYIYFDNDEKGFAVANAETFKKLVEQKRVK